jgi:hypothetical protein
LYLVLPFADASLPICRRLAARYTCHESAIHLNVISIVWVEPGNFRRQDTQCKGFQIVQSYAR